MPHRPITTHQNSDNHKHKTPLPHKQTLQHGIVSSLRNRLPQQPSGDATLIGLPSETLTHITSFLPPSALFALGGTNKQFHEHVKDDNTWRRAYVYQFLGISPEDDIREGGGKGGPTKAIMIRRTEANWRREFVLRWNLRRRYERSRSAPITHVPVHSAAVDMHLMPSNPSAPTIPPGLLAASLQYGVVSRSYPLTGKVLRGYFDAAGTHNGLGVGNPNAEFSPDVTKCTMSSDGGTAKVLWGFRSGSVAVTVAAKAMDTSKPTGGKWLKCSPAHQHDGSVEDAAWAGGSSHYYCVTGGVDGKVKLWDGKKVICLWTSTPLAPSQTNLPGVRDPCVKVAIDLQQDGLIASVLRSGLIRVWVGFGQVLGNEGTLAAQDLALREFTFAPPPHVPRSAEPGEDAPAAREAIGLHLHYLSKDTISLLAVYTNDTHFYRATVDVTTGNVEHVAYGDDTTGTITSLEPIFGADNTSFVLAGDQLGYVSVYPWSDSNPRYTVKPIRKLEVFGRGAVSAIKWTPAVLVTGSSLGSVEVWDSLNFAHLRTFPSVGLRSVTEQIWDPVSRIIVEKDLVIASVGAKVMAWLGGPIINVERKGKHLKIASKANQGVAKWQRQVELYKDIADSQRELEDEQTYVRRKHGKEREQLVQLDALGLSEVEAVEYVLMLSRDEEEARRLRDSRTSNTPQPEDEGVFIGDFDDIQQQPVAVESLFYSHSSPSRPPTSRSSPPSGRLYPRVTPSTSNGKVQVSPWFPPEPMEAGMSISPLSHEISSGSFSPSSVRSNATTVISSDDPEHFPNINAGSRGSTNACTPVRRSASGSASPGSARSVSAWSTPLRMTKSEGPSSPAVTPGQRSRGNTPGPSSPARQRVILSSMTQGLTSSATPPPAASSRAAELAAREEEDLRYAIELSLAEARSRGEDI